MATALFYLMFISYLVLYVLKTAGYYWPFISDHLADFLCLPIVLSFCRFTMIRWRFAPSQFELSVSMILFAVLAFSIVFEGILPSLSDRYYSDPIDIVAYLLGAAVYFSFRKFYKNTQHEILHHEL